MQTQSSHDKKNLFYNIWSMLISVLISFRISVMFFMFCFTLMVIGEVFRKSCDANVIQGLEKSNHCNCYWNWGCM